MLSRKCPNCKFSINFKRRLLFIVKENIECPKCNRILLSTIVGGAMGVPFGGIAWFLVDSSLRGVGIPSFLSMLLGFATCMFVVRLGYPFGPLISFEKEEDIAL